VLPVEIMLERNQRSLLKGGREHRRLQNVSLFYSKQYYCMKYVSSP